MPLSITVDGRYELRVHSCDDPPNPQFRSFIFSLERVLSPDLVRSLGPPKSSGPITSHNKFRRVVIRVILPIAGRLEGHDNIEYIILIFPLLLFNQTFYIFCFNFVTGLPIVEMFRFINKITGLTRPTATVHKCFASSAPKPIINPPIKYTEVIKYYYRRFTVVIWVFYYYHHDAVKSCYYRLPPLIRVKPCKCIFCAKCTYLASKGEAWHDKS